jgi:anti-anti-sigma regulatory factor
MPFDGVLKLDDDCTIKSAGHIHQLLSDASRRGRSVVIDCSNIVQADTSFIQLLISGQKTFRGCGLDLEIVDATEALCAVVKRAGMHIDPATKQIS